MASSVVALIIKDHRTVQSMWDMYTKENSLERKQALAWSITRELSMHAACEEEVVYPEIAKALGESASDHCLGEHQKLKEQLNALDSMKVSDSNYDVKMSEMMADFLRHLKEEEEELLPKLVQMNIDVNDLGVKFMNAKSHAPTRPHPMAPNKPPLNIAANMSAAPLDWAADQIRFAGTTPITS